MDLSGEVEKRVDESDRGEVSIHKGETKERVLGKRNKEKVENGLSPPLPIRLPSLDLNYFSITPFFTHSPIPKHTHNTVLTFTLSPQTNQTLSPINFISPPSLSL
ncbi:hypothetical protein ACP275_03G030900 [Erythranthe tilingii]